MQNRLVSLLNAHSTLDADNCAHPLYHFTLRLIQPCDGGPNWLQIPHRWWAIRMCIPRMESAHHRNGEGHMYIGIYERIEMRESLCEVSSTCCNLFNQMFHQFCSHLVLRRSSPWGIFATFHTISAPFFCFFPFFFCFSFVSFEFRLFSRIRSFDYVHCVLLHRHSTHRRTPCVPRLFYFSLTKPARNLFSNSFVNFLHLAHFHIRGH